MAAEGYGFEDVVLYYDHLMEHLKWKKLGHVLAGGNGDVGDIEGKDGAQHSVRKNPKKAPEKPAPDTAKKRKPEREVR